MQQAKLDSQLCFEVYRAANQFTKLYAKALQPFQLTYPQYLVLLILWDQDEQTSSTIGQRLGLGIGTLNPVLKKLIEKGWLTKAPCCNDMWYDRSDGTTCAEAAYDAGKSLWGSLMDITSQHEILAHVCFLDPIVPDERHRRDIALEARDAIVRTLFPAMRDSRTDTDADLRVVAQ